MPTVSQPKNLGDLLKYEAPNLYSRDQDTVAAAQNLPLGTVVGRETATAKLKALDPVLKDLRRIALVHREDDRREDSMPTEAELPH